MNGFKIIGIFSLFLLGCSTQEINVRFLDTGYAKEQLLKKSIRIVPPKSVEVLAYNKAFDRMFRTRQGYVDYVTSTLKKQLDTLRTYGAVTISPDTSMAAGAGDYFVTVKQVKIANRMDLVRSTPSSGGSTKSIDHCIVGILFEVGECATMKKVFEVEITAEESVFLVFTGSALKAATTKVLKDFAEYLNKNL
jgi:hypothetical protein